MQAQLCSSPSERDAKARAVAKLYAVLASESLPDTFADLRNAAYLEALEQFPAWAVEGAAKCWIGGDFLEAGENRKFVPKPVELIRIVRRLMDPVRRDIADLTAGIERMEDQPPPQKQVPREKLVEAASQIVSTDRLSEMCAQAGVSPEDIPDQPSRFKKAGALISSKEIAA